MVAGEEAPSGDRTEMGDPKEDKNDRDGAGRTGQDRTRAGPRGGGQTKRPRDRGGDDGDGVRTVDAGEPRLGR